MTLKKLRLFWVKDAIKYNSGNKAAAARELDIIIERLNKILKGTDRGGL